MGKLVPISINSTKQANYCQLREFKSNASFFLNVCFKTRTDFWSEDCILKVAVYFGIFD